jgi:hypothetical protein
MRIRGISPICEAECTINNGKLFALIGTSINENPLLTLQYETDLTVLQQVTSV